MLTLRRCTRTWPLAMRTGLDRDEPQPEYLCSSSLTWPPPWQRSRPPVSQQSEFNFEADRRPDGYDSWVMSRRLAARDLAHRLNLPLNRQVEVWLRGGIRLRGLLRLKEEELFIEEDRLRHLEFTVDGVSFTYRELESCVALG